MQLAFGTLKLVLFHIFECHLLCLNHCDSFCEMKCLLSVTLIYTDMLEAVCNKHSALFWKITPADDIKTRRCNNATHLSKLLLAAMAESQNHSDLINAWLLGSVAYP